jgi:hypothetical protein
MGSWLLNLLRPIVGPLLVSSADSVIIPAINAYLEKEAAKLPVEQQAIIVDLLPGIEAVIKAEIDMELRKVFG